jgi:hypothetical protein
MARTWKDAPRAYRSDPHWYDELERMYRSSLKYERPYRQRVREALSHEDYDEIPNHRWFSQHSVWIQFWYW